MKYWFYIFLLLFSCHQQQYDNEKLIALQKSVEQKGLLELTKEYSDTLKWIGFWQGEGEKEKITHTTKRLFSFLNQDIFVQMQFLWDFEIDKQLEQKYPGMRPRTYIAYDMYQNNEYWDIMPWFGDSDRQLRPMLNDPEYPGNFFVDFRDSTWLTNSLKDYVKNHRVTQEMGFFPGPIIEGFYNVFFYNADLAEKIGLEIKQFGMTADDLISYCKQIDQYNQKNGTNIGTLYDSNDWKTLYFLVESFFKSAIGFEGNYEIPPYFTNKHQKALLEVYQKLEEMGKYNALYHKAKDNSWGATWEQILNDEVVFYVNATWMYCIWKEIDSAKIKRIIPCQMPVIRPYPYCMGGYVPTFAVLKNAPNREAAIKLVKHICTKDFAEDWVSKTKTPTGLKQHIESTGIGGDPYDVFIATMTEKYIRNTNSWSNYKYILGKSYSSYDFTILVHELLNGNITAEEALNRVVNKIDELNAVSD